MAFSKKWLRNHPQFLLHFLIHIDVFMVCRKFELIPTSIFQVMRFKSSRPALEHNALAPITALLLLITIINIRTTCKQGHILKLIR